MEQEVKKHDYYDRLDLKSNASKKDIRKSLKIYEQKIKDTEDISYLKSIRKTLLNNRNRKEYDAYLRVDNELIKMELFDRLDTINEYNPYDCWYRFTYEIQQIISKLYDIEIKLQSSLIKRNLERQKELNTIKEVYLDELRTINNRMLTYINEKNILQKVKCYEK